LQVNVTAIKVGTGYLEWGAISQGDCQGCNLFPLLFIIYMKEILDNGDLLLTAASP
jgi:hypothetical protein